MNKRRFLKALMLSLVVAIAVGFMTTNVMAQVIGTQIQLCSPLAYPIGQTTTKAADAYLIDNFENWRNPRDNGWSIQEPCYPIYGYGLGYGQVTHVLDFEEGSQVMDVYRPMSVFLFNTQYTMYMVSKSLIYDSNADGDRTAVDSDDVVSLPGAYSMMSVKLRAPIGIESFDLFQILVNIDINGDDVTIVFAPIEGGARGCDANGVDSVVKKDGAKNNVEDNDVIQVCIGRQFSDGTWHLVMQDLDEIVDKYYDADVTIDEIVNFTMRGNQYRLDDVMFVKPEKSIKNNGVPHLFRIGPVYGTLFEPYGSTRMIFAEDPDLGINATMITDPNDDDYGNFTIPGIVIMGPDETDPAGDVQYNIALGDANSSSFEGLNVDDIRICKIGEEGEVLRDPNGTPRYIDNESANLNFIFNIGDTLGPEDHSAMGIPLGEKGDGITQDIIDSCPPYLLQEDGTMIYNLPNQDPNVDGYYDASFSNPMYVLACAWQNSGYNYIPNVRIYAPSLGLVFEDRIVTCRVTDGIATDKETFTVSIVNYQVSNNPPLINDVDDQVFQVGRVNTYRIMAHDVDAQDMGGLVYHATMNGLPSYQVGTTNQALINATNGLLAFTPLGEGALTCVVTVTDPRGMWAVAEFTIFCTNPGTWFNHPPVVLGDLDTPQTIRAGQMFVANQMDIIDPDGDNLYWSCNIGAIGDDGIWTFQTMFPGQYLVQISAYDSWGGACITEFIIQVLPVWAI